MKVSILLTLGTFILANSQILSDYYVTDSPVPLYCPCPVNCKRAWHSNKECHAECDIAECKWNEGDCLEYLGGVCEGRMEIENSKTRETLEIYCRSRINTEKICENPLNLALAPQWHIKDYACTWVTGQTEPDRVLATEACHSTVSCVSDQWCQQNCVQRIKIYAHKCAWDTKRPSKYPTKFPTRWPTRYPTKHPSPLPTKPPTTDPTSHPTYHPSTAPTPKPTAPAGPCSAGERLDDAIEACVACAAGKYNHGNMPFAQEHCYGPAPAPTPTHIVNPSEPFVYLNATDVACHAPWWAGVPVYEDGEYEGGCVDAAPPSRSPSTAIPTQIPIDPPTVHPTILPVKTPTNPPPSRRTSPSAHSGESPSSHSHPDDHHHHEESSESPTDTNKYDLAIAGITITAIIALAGVVLCCRHTHHHPHLRPSAANQFEQARQNIIVGRHPDDHRHHVTIGQPLPTAQIQPLREFEMTQPKE